jgi:hypothetical protein
MFTRHAKHLTENLHEIGLGEDGIGLRAYI